MPHDGNASGHVADSDDPEENQAGYSEIWKGRVTQHLQRRAQGRAVREQAEEAPVSSTDLLRFAGSAWGWAHPAGSACLGILEAGSEEVGNENLPLGLMGLRGLGLGNFHRQDQPGGMGLIALDREAHGALGGDAGPWGTSWGR